MIASPFAECAVVLGDELRARLSDQRVIPALIFKEQCREGLSERAQADIAAEVLPANAGPQRRLRLRVLRRDTDVINSNLSAGCAGPFRPGMAPGGIHQA
jgi:hypothetical protein